MEENTIKYRKIGVFNTPSPSFIGQATCYREGLISLNQNSNTTTVSRPSHIVIEYWRRGLILTTP